MKARHLPGNGRGGTAFDGLVSLAGAAGLALVVPVAILFVGLPLVLAVRVLLEIILWLQGAS